MATKSNKHNFKLHSQATAMIFSMGDNEEKYQLMHIRTIDRVEDETSMRMIEKTQMILSIQADSTVIYDDCVNYNDEDGVFSTSQGILVMKALADLKVIPSFKNPAQLHNV